MIILYLKLGKGMLATGIVTTEPLTGASCIKGALITQSQIFQEDLNVKRLNAQFRKFNMVVSGSTGSDDLKDFSGRF